MMATRSWTTLPRPSLRPRSWTTSTSTSISFALPPTCVRLLSSARMLPLTRTRRTSPSLVERCPLLLTSWNSPSHSCSTWRSTPSSEPLSMRARASCSGSATSPQRPWPTLAELSTTSTRQPMACSRTFPRATTRSAPSTVSPPDPDARPARRFEDRGGGPHCQPDDDPGPVRDSRPVHLGTGQGLNSRHNEHSQYNQHQSIIGGRDKGGEEIRKYIQKEIQLVYMLDLYGGISTTKLLLL